MLARWTPRSSAPGGRILRSPVSYWAINAPALRLHGPAGPLVTTSFLAGMHDAAVVTEFTAARFRAQIGLAPKPAARVLRFRRAAELLLAPAAGLSIAQVAATCGYADQSHLVREFRALAGCTPSGYVAEWASVVPGRPSDPDGPGPTVGP